MNTANSSLSSISRPGWQMLGETDLSAGSTIDTIGDWLIELLTSLNLHPVVAKQLLKSARDATLRALYRNADTSNVCVHLVVFASNERTDPGNTWGFFRIEKTHSAEPKNDLITHTVEFYLYVEGQ